LIYVLTGGGPGGATSSLSIYGFNAYILGDFGFGSAVSVITFLLILVFTIIYLRVGHFQEALKMSEKRKKTLFIWIGSIITCIICLLPFFLDASNFFYQVS